MYNNEVCFTNDGETRYQPAKKAKSEIFCQMCNRCFNILRKFGCQHSFCLSCCKLLEFQCSVCKQHLLHSNYVSTNIDNYIQQNALKLFNIKTKQTYNTLKEMQDDVCTIEECQQCKQQYFKGYDHKCLKDDPNSLIKKYIPNIGPEISLNALNMALMEIQQRDNQQSTYFNNERDDLQVVIDSVKLNAIAFLRVFNPTSFIENHHLCKMQFQRLRTLTTLEQQFKYDNFTSKIVIDTIIHFLELQSDSTEQQELHLILNNRSFQISAIQLLQISQLIKKNKIQLRWVFMLQFQLVDDPFIIEEMGIKLFHQSSIMIDIHNDEYKKQIYALIARKVFSNVYHLGYPNIEQAASQIEGKKEHILYQYKYNTRRMYNDFVDNQQHTDNINLSDFEIPYFWQMIYSLQSLGSFKENQIISIYKYEGYLYDIFTNKLIILQNGQLNVKNQDFKFQLYDIMCVLYAIIKYRASGQLNQFILKSFKRINLHLIDQEKQQLNEFKYKDDFFNLLSAFIVVLDKNKLNSFSLDSETSKMIIPPQNFPFLQSIIRLALTLYIFQPKSLQKNHQFNLILPNFATNLQTHYLDNHVQNNRFYIENMNIHPYISKQNNDGQNIIQMPSIDILCINENFDENSIFSQAKFNELIQQSQQDERLYCYQPKSISSTVLPARTQMALMIMLTQNDPVLFIKLIYFTQYQHLTSEQLKIFTQNYIENELQRSLQQSNFRHTSFTSTTILNTENNTQSKTYYSQLMQRGIYFIDFDYYQNYLFYQYDQKQSLAKKLLSFSFSKNVEDADEKQINNQFTYFQNFYFYTGDLVQFSDCLSHYQDSYIFIYNFPCYFQSITDCGTLLTEFFNDVQLLKHCITNSPMLHLTNHICQQFGFMDINTIIPYNQTLYQKYLLQQNKNSFYYNTEQFYYCLDQLAHVCNQHTFAFLLNQNEYIQNTQLDLFDKIQTDIQSIQQVYANFTQIQLINSDLIFVNTSYDEQTNVILYFLNHFCKVEADSATLNTFINELSYTIINLSNQFIYNFIEIFLSKLANQYNAFKQQVDNNGITSTLGAQDISLSITNSKAVYLNKQRLQKQLFNSMLTNEQKNKYLFQMLKITNFNLYDQDNTQIIEKLQNLYNIVPFMSIQVNTNKNEHDDSYKLHQKQQNEQKNNIFINNIKLYMKFCLDNGIQCISGPIEFKELQQVLNVINGVSDTLDYVSSVLLDCYELVLEKYKEQFNNVKIVIVRQLSSQQLLDIQQFVTFFAKLALYTQNVTIITLAQLNLEYTEQNILQICRILQNFKELKLLIIDNDTAIIEQFKANKIQFQVTYPEYCEKNGSIVKDYCCNQGDK